ncbi:MAG: DsbA family protein [Nanoarchaeota archaeon]
MVKSHGKQHKKIPSKTGNHSKKEKTQHKKRQHHESQHESHKTSHQHKPTKKSLSKRVRTWQAVTVILAFLFLASLATGGFGFDMPKLSMPDLGTAGQDTAVDSPVSVTMYVMSQCPYGVQAQDTMIPAVQDIGEDNVDLRTEYIASDNGDGTFQSLHGQSEVEGNIVQLCAEQYAPEKHLDLIMCMNENQDNIPDNWKSCAEELNMPVEDIKGCYEGSEGKDLLRESLEKAQNAEATGSPTIFIDGERYEGGRQEADFKRAICTAFEGEKPKACSDIPEPTSVDVTVLDAKDCDNCDTQAIIATTKQLFPGAEIDTVEATSDEGKELIETYNIEKAPAYLFSSSVSDTQMWKQEEGLEQSFIKHDDGSYRLLDQATGATYHLDEAERQEQEALKESYPKENMKTLNASGDKPRLDYFVMAFCPYGNPADESASELYEAFGDKVEIVPHYIVSVSGDSIQSLHGEQEGNQGVRELCALEELGKEAFFDFTLAANDQCSAEDADSCWKDAAESAGVDTEAIASCYEDNRLQYAKEQDSTIQNVSVLRQGQLTAPTASPTFLINGETYSGERDTNSIKSALCNEFETAPAVCEEVIETDNSAAQPSAGEC